MFNIFSNKKTFLGIDIGTSFIKIVELKKKAPKPVLENYGEMGVLKSGKPFRIFEKETLLLSNQDIAKAIQMVLKEAGISTKEVVFSIPDFSTFFTNISLPKMTKEEVSESIKYEIRPYIPLPSDAITLDWLITEGELGKTAVKILAVAIPNDVINQYREIASLAGLDLKYLEPEVFSLARVVRPLIGDKVAALIDIGARTTTCSVLEKGILNNSDSFNIGSAELTNILARSLSLGYNEAEELKIRTGLKEESLMPLINELVNEIKRSFKSYFEKHGKEIEAIVLAGGSALLPGLKEYFTQEIGKEVSVINPFLNISYPENLKETLQEIGPAYSIAVGSALKGIE